MYDRFGWLSARPLSSRDARNRTCSSRPGRAAMPGAAAIAFLICDSCGEVVEADSGALRGSLSALASEAQFSPRPRVLEVTGVCKACAAG